MIKIQDSPTSGKGRQAHHNQPEGVTAGAVSRGVDGVSRGVDGVDLMSVAVTIALSHRDPEKSVTSISGVRISDLGSEHTTIVGTSLRKPTVFLDE